MSFVEVPTSRQDKSYDADGNVHLSRTFKVMDVAPANFFQSITSIPAYDGSGATMPDYGHVWETAGGPSPLLGVGDGTATKVTLHEWILQPIDAVLFYAVARYTNDPRTAPNGQHFQVQQLSSLVGVPYARSIPVLQTGASAAELLGSFTEDSINCPVAVRRTSQTVVWPRKKLSTITAAATAQAKCLHDLDGNRWPHKFEGFDLRLRGAQWYDVTYHWTWESGIDILTREGTQKVLNAAGSAVPGVNAIYPPPNASLSDYIQANNSGGPRDMILHPHHTMTMLWSNIGGIRSPSWLYRLPLTDTRPDGWRTLAGSSKFEYA